MPDCSYVTLTVAGGAGDRVAALIEETGRRSSMDWEGEDGAGDVVRQFEFEESAWGVSYLSEDGWGAEGDLLERLRGEGIAYNAADGGHYTWDAFEVAWAPGMVAPARRSCGVEGGPVLDSATYRAAVERYGRGRRLAAWVAGYFSGDPAAWEVGL